MSSQQIILLPPTLPVGYCIEPGTTGLQQFVNTVINGTVATLVQSTGSTFFNYGPDIPGADFRDYPWLRFSTTNPELNGVWNFLYGYWIMAHPIPPGDGMRRFVIMDPSTVDTYDGGESAVAGELSGPMWEIDTGMACRFPIGAGTLPSGGVIAFGDTGGEENHTLTVDELASHYHQKLEADNASHDASSSVSNVTSSLLVSAGTTPGPGHCEISGSVTGSTGGGEAHNNMPPYKVGLFLKRSSTRKWYRLGP